MSLVALMRLLVGSGFHTWIADFAAIGRRLVTGSSRRKAKGFSRKLQARERELSGDSPFGNEPLL